MDSGPDGNSKSIEMQAHDPKRYIGDMFAWLHQAIPSEKENLMQLLEKCNRNGSKNGDFSILIFSNGYLMSAYRSFGRDTKGISLYNGWSLPST